MSTYVRACARAGAPTAAAANTEANSVFLTFMAELLRSWGPSRLQGMPHRYRLRWWDPEPSRTVSVPACFQHSAHAAVRHAPTSTATSPEGGVTARDRC